MCMIEWVGFGNNSDQPLLTVCFGSRARTSSLLASDPGIAPGISRAVWEGPGWPTGVDPGASPVEPPAGSCSPCIGSAGIPDISRTVGWSMPRPLEAQALWYGRGPGVR